jgi:predicted nucleic acid-binding protein
VRFWDTSALVPLLVTEARTDAVVRTLASDESIVVAWTTEIECASALARFRREGSLDSPGERRAFDRLAAHAAAWSEVQPAVAVRGTAVRLLRVHPLRTGDAVQLASAVVAAEADPRTIGFVTLDVRLAEIADREGFQVIVPGAAGP